MDTLLIFYCALLNFYGSPDMQIPGSTVLYWNNESLIPSGIFNILHRYVHILFILSWSKNSFVSHLSFISILFPRAGKKKKALENITENALVNVYFRVSALLLTEIFNMSNIVRCH
jgi:hypothetical protein